MWLKLLHQAINNHPNINQFLGITECLETPIKNTHSEYQKLYENCWNEEPNLRPNIEEVYKILNKLKSQVNKDDELPPNINNNDQNETDKNIRAFEWYLKHLNCY
ncbi:hypothetical protein C1645_834446 [Glomus cerebriforme]|uniref:Serine-threonine/tyrosine-protein kinase catalytic domain-containing protein n=1 Tax=Glomus cerebriforme TaxID=658196 RepID=A0A397SC04_9GLOM|nr:hypothetical protein C1645_834446 [Glomus cerebriforme]